MTTVKQSCQYPEHNTPGQHQRVKRLSLIQDKEGCYHRYNEDIDNKQFPFYVDMPHAQRDDPFKEKETDTWLLIFIDYTCSYEQDI